MPSWDGLLYKVSAPEVLQALTARPDIVIEIEMSSFSGNIEQCERLEILLIGEKLRESLQDCGMIQNRKYHLRTYRNCVVGRELLDWLVRNKHCETRQCALEALKVLQDHNILHHVCDDHDVKDDVLYYRFRRDDDTYRQFPNLDLFYTAFTLYNGLSTRTHGIMRAYQQDGELYRSAFPGAEFVDHVMQNGAAGSREEGLALGRKLLENDVIRHVTDDFHFRDDRRLLYQFTVDFAGRRLLSDVFNYVGKGACRSVVPRDRMRSSVRFSQSKFFTPTSSPSNTPEQRRKLEPVVSSHEGIPSDVTLDVDRSRTHSGDSGNDTDSSETATDTSSFRSVLLRHATVHELLSPDTPYVKKTIRVRSDPVGYGFVIRGCSPTYVQAVDPQGPAAAAGLKVRQYIYSVNGQYVLTNDHKEVGSKILQSDSHVTLVVLTHKRDSIL
ncbi:DEP domain-containing mTOR-interacting protein-like [Dreissena polymorpha]|uniref:DEP domain-containing protein n=1 Tax=Dreissena polymorpha TaxID=45954 RepID=A0A9D3YA77_DREPO|nr:DEP domain-containing mTOR-interacting protein-like [Dreissena polymorpha]KAH3694665.1 hypothetical protein DPMN_082106 [Dreissena polymorpha]